MEGDNAGVSNSGLLQRLKPYLCVISMQFGYAGLAIISMMALNQGMSHYVLVVYRHLVATAVMTPFAFMLERKQRPKMTYSIFFKIVALGLLEPVLDQNLYYTGMKYTSATFTSAMCNMLPALTFVMACLCRMEKVNIKKARSQAKVLGTILTVAGAMAMTLFKGPILKMVWTNGRINAVQTAEGEKDWVKGALMLTAACFCWACFIILQTFTLRSYPAELSLTAWICLAGTVEGAAVALAVERGKTAVWSLGWNASLLAAVYAGIVCSGFSYYIQSGVMKTRGPVFVAAFSPLTMIIVAILGSFILAEKIYLGRVIGAIIIVMGLYTVVWGKSKDHLVPSPATGPLEATQDLPMADINSKSSKVDELISIDVRTQDGPANLD